MSLSAQIKHVVEAGAPVVATTTIFGWLIGVLPSIAAFLSIIWIGMQMVMGWEKFYRAFKKLLKRDGGEH